MNLLRRFAGWLRPKLPYLNIGLALGAWWANDHVDQVFCRPVPWAAWVLVVSTTAFLVWPWLRRGSARAQYLALFLQGLFLLVCGYCMWFFGWRTYLASIPFTLIVIWKPFAPLLIWVPVLFAVQVVSRVRHTSLPGTWLACAAGVLPTPLVIGWADYQFRQVAAAVATLPPEQRQDINALGRVVPRTYIAERLAGTDFKYHNYFCVYDGVRPALHDPLVNVCLWMRGGSDVMGGGVDYKANPLALIGDVQVDKWLVPEQERADAGYLAEQQAYVNRQASLYHLLFPAMPLNAGCACTPGHGTITVQAR